MPHVLLRALQERRLIDTQRGRIAVGWLIVEDLAMVMALVLHPAIAGAMGKGGDAAPAAGVVLGLLPEQGRSLILAGAILSILINPLMFAAIDWLEPRSAARGGRQRGHSRPAARAEVLATANLACARHLIVTVPNAFEAAQVIRQARAARPDLTTIARAHADTEVDYLTDAGADAVVMGERELARGIVAEIGRRAA